MGSTLTADMSSPQRTCCLVTIPGLSVATLLHPIEDDWSHLTAVKRPRRTVVP
jgi:hypothetical protein